MPYPALANHRYFCRVERLLLDGGERFATVVDADGAPAYYPTCLALARRSRSLSVETLAAEAADLVHLGQWAMREGIDINARLEAGAYLDTAEIETLAEACGLTTRALRRMNARKISEIRRGASVTRADLVTNNLKGRRLTIAMQYFDLVGRMAEARLPKRSKELSRRIEDRHAMLKGIKIYRPRVLSSRVRGIVPAGDLARVAIFVATGDPLDIWKKEAIARRNWALVRTLGTTGVRQGEARQLKVSDLDLARCELRVERRHDDPEDPRIREPNAKTYDRIIPFGDDLAGTLEEYVLGPGSDAAEKKGSPFLFLSHDNRTHGSPISSSTARRVVKELGEHLGIAGLTPHHLRHGWVQNLADWAIETGIEAAEFERFANNLGGWSYLSKMATEYRGDHLTQAAYKAGLKVQGERS